MELIFYLTNKCNMNCKYCYEGEKKNKELSFEIAKKCIYTYSQKHKNMCISFFGGEPLLNFNLMKQILEYCREVEKLSSCKITHTITTNATLIDQDFIKTCKKHKVKVGISIDGDEKTHNLNRVFKDKTGSFEKTHKGVEQVIKSGLKTMALPVVCLNNVKYMADNVEYLINQGFKEITLNFNYFDNWDDESIAVLKEQYSKVEKIYLKENKILKRISIFPIDTKMVYLLNEKLNCCDSCNSTRLCVDSDGKYYPCVQFVGKEDYSIGNYVDGENIKKRGELIKQRLNSNVPCSKCAYKRLCASYCGCIRMCSTNTITEISPLVCETEKIYINSAINILKK